MYSVRGKNGLSTWAMGTFSEKLGYFIKYNTEYERSTWYKKDYEYSGLTIDRFYEKKLNINFCS